MLLVILIFSAVGVSFYFWLLFVNRELDRLHNDAENWYKSKTDDDKASCSWKIIYPPNIKESSDGEEM